ncbi:MAG: ribbon-helix-helix domain-containing protein [Gemmatimonadota bacterium]
MIRTQISLDRRMYDEARAEARRQGISFAELVRRALAQLLQPRSADRPWMRLAGAIEGPPDASQTVDTVVYGRDVP